MMKEEIMRELAENNKFEYRTVNYKSEDDQLKYGLSFEAITPKEFEEVAVNGKTYKAKRIIEEFGSILLIYDFNQVEFDPGTIDSFEVL